MAALPAVGASDEWSRNWPVVLGSFWANFCVFGVMKGNSVVFVGFLDDFGLKREEATWPIALHFACVCIGSVSTSYLIRYLSMRQLSVVAAVVMSLSVSLCYFATKLSHLIVLFGIIQGTGLGIMIVVQYLVINNAFDRFRMRALGLSMSGSSIGMFVFTPVMQIMLKEYRIFGLCLLLGGILLNSVLGFLVMTSPQVFTESGKNDPSSDDIVRDDSKMKHCNETTESTRASPSKPNIQRLSTLQVLVNPDFLLICLVYVIANNMMYIFNTVALDFARDRNIPDELGSFLVSGMAVGDLVGRLGFGWIADSVSWTRKTLLSLCLLLLVVVFILLPLCQGYVAFLMSSVSTALLFGCTFICYSPILVDHFGLENLPIALGYFMNIVSLSSVGRIFIVGYFRDQKKSYDLLFMSLAVAQLAAIVLWYMKDFVLKMKRIISPNATN